MILYHGSNQQIVTIDLSKGKKFKDFGQGFYTTHIKKQAEYWSRRITDRFGGTPTVTMFDFDIDAVFTSGLNIKVFEKPDRDIESPAYIYELLKEEFRRGTLRGLTE